MTHERNRTVSRFLHNGENYLIHERSSRLSNGQMYTRRFIVNSDGDWQGEASTVKDARKLLDSQATARKAEGGVE